MKHLKLSWGAVSFIVILLCAIPVGCNMISSCKNSKSEVDDTMDTNEDYEVEYANFYDDNKIVEAVDAVHGGN